MEEPLSPDIRELIADLKDTCLAAEGIGLAAPQIGVSKRVIVVNDSRAHPYALINPDITQASHDTSTLEEGCLSIPDTVVRVTRPRSVRVRALNEQSKPVQIAATDLLAKVLQHEIDHLNGLLITDYASKTPPRRAPGESAFVY